jgi:group I intron endonuclease
MSERKKQLKQEYAQTPRAAGVFQIRNTVNEKVFVGSNTNLSGIFNRHEFQLKADGHPNKKLQSDWNEFGAEKFAFEVLEEVEPRDNPNYDLRADLEFYENIWLEKLEPYGERGYNEKKITRDERLKMIAANRSAE